MRIVQIDTVYGYGSTGKIVQTLHRSLEQAGHLSKVYFGRGDLAADAGAHKIANGFEVYADAGLSRVTGYMGVFSPLATRRLLRELDEIKPDVVHLHEVHGYYLNLMPLLDYLRAKKIPVVWTLHCEFAYTGRCGSALSCEQWKTECVKCPDLRTYPVSWFFDRSAVQFAAKRKILTDFDRILFVPVSGWVQSRLEQSFLRRKEHQVVHNGIDTINTYYPRDSLEYGELLARHSLIGRFVVLCVAPDILSDAKGGKIVFEVARRVIGRPITFVMIGASSRRVITPPNVVMLGLVADPNVLAQYYSLADVFMITSPSETFSLTCTESLACGTPIIGFDSGGPAEVAPSPYGHFVPVGDIDGLVELVEKSISGALSLPTAPACRDFAAQRYSNARMFNNYMRVYESVAQREKTPHSPLNRTLQAGVSHDAVTSRDPITCSNCIMDTSDPRLHFDSQGVCDYCHNYKALIEPAWRANIADPTKLIELAGQIKTDGKHGEFDCIIGLSGGLDSSYSAYVAKRLMGLRPLLVHVDAGWNTDQAVGNIERLVDGLGLELYTEVIDWEEMKDLQVAFLKSGIPDQDLPQDAAFFSGLYKFARAHKIKHVITGSNYSTECCREPEEWGGYLGIDSMLFHDIHRQFGKQKLETFPLTDILVYKIWYQQLLGMQIHHPLNLVPFVKRNAEEELGRLFGWKPFQHKHHESRFTRFYEDYWLPRRFGFHKRRAHFSSLIQTGQMSREAALERISEPEMDAHFLRQEFEYVAHKLDLTVDELQRIFESPKKTYRDYRNKRWMIGLGASVMRRLGIEKRFFR